MPNFDGVVNIQGDEPFIEPEQIDEVCVCLRQPEVAIATLAQRVIMTINLEDTGEVLVTVDGYMNALYFSRAAILFLRNPTAAPRHEQFRYLKHVGLYAYTAASGTVAQLPPSTLEVAESWNNCAGWRTGCRCASVPRSIPLSAWTR